MAQAVIYYTHFVSDSVKREIGILSRELGAEFTLFAVGCCPEASTLDDLATDRVAVRSYLRDELRTLPYPQQLLGVNWETMRRNPDLAIMRFFRGNPHFDQYWIIEYDVRFSGKWSTLFNELNSSPAELLCTHVTPFKYGREWVHWSSFSAAGKDIAEDNLIRGFFPFCRLSNRLMRAIDERCRLGWTGHPEVLWPTIARAVGASIEDIGGTGPSVPESRRGKFYQRSITHAGHFLSTFGAWPAFSNKNSFNPSTWPDTLWHPVKE
jgi:hypothetical protein